MTFLFGWRRGEHVPSCETKQTRQLRSFPTPSSLSFFFFFFVLLIIIFFCFFFLCGYGPVKSTQGRVVGSSARAASSAAGTLPGSACQQPTATAHVSSRPELAAAASIASSATSFVVVVDVDDDDDVDDDVDMVAGSDNVDEEARDTADGADAAAGSPAAAGWAPPTGSPAASPAVAARIAAAAAATRAASLGPRSLASVALIMLHLAGCLHVYERERERERRGLFWTTAFRWSSILRRRLRVSCLASSNSQK